MNPAALEWLMFAGLLAAIVFVSIGARALQHFSRRELEEICARRNAQDLFGEVLRLHDRTARGVETLGIFLTVLLLGVCAAWFVRALSQRDATWLAEQNLWLLFFLYIVGGSLVLAAAKLWIPHTVARLWGAGFVYRTWRLWRWSNAALTPLLFFGQLLDGLLHRLAGRAPTEPSGDTFEEEIRSIVTEGHREGLLEEEAREMIEGVIDLRDSDVSQIMTPRTDLHILHVGLPWEKMIDYVIKVGHTRIPVYDKSRDDIIGVLYSKDLLPELAKGDDHPRRPLQEILRPAYFVPETKAVSDLLAEFQRTRNHMAIVLDEYGGVSGLVTIEDVLEEIVGEIVDEYDEEVVQEIRKIDAFTCEALGRAHIDEINEELGLSLPEEEDYDTIAGFVFSELGRVPAAGESLTYQDSARITVLEATRRRIERVRIELLSDVERELA